MVITGNPADVAGAYVKARAQIETLLVKDGKANRSTYLTLAGILAAITPTLIANGLVLMQETTSNEYGVGVSTTLLHSSGASIDFAPLTMQPAHLKPQTVGSTISYCRRYSLISALGLVGGKEDDDGEKGTYGDKPKAQPTADYHEETWAPNETPARKDKISKVTLARIEKLMLTYYGEKWKEVEAQLVTKISKGDATNLAQLVVSEGEFVIGTLEKRIAERAAEMQQTHANGAVHA